MTAPDVISKTIPSPAVDVVLMQVIIYLAFAAPFGNPSLPRLPSRDKRRRVGKTNRTPGMVTKGEGVVSSCDGGAFKVSASAERWDPLNKACRCNPAQVRFRGPLLYGFADVSECHLPGDGGVWPRRPNIRLGLRRLTISETPASERC